MLLASVAFSVMAALVQVAAVDTWTVVLVRSVVVGLVAAAWLRLRGRPLHFSDHRLLLVRGLFGWGAMVAYFAALPMLALGTAVTLQYTSPLFVALLAPWLLGERPRAPVWVALGVGFAGVLLVARPEGGDIVGSSLALASGALAAVAYLAIRSLRATDHPDAIVVHFSGLAAALTVPLWAFRSPSWPTVSQGVALLGVGLTAAFGQVAMTRAYRDGDAAEVAGISYVAVPLGTGIGMALWGERPDPISLLGAALVVVAGLALGRGAGLPRGAR
jgi:drug/metabolite transporter (DMT)-like permease